MSEPSAVGGQPSIPRFSRLRWQLTFSHMRAIALTVVLMITFQQLAVGWWFHAREHGADEAARDARTIARMVGGVAARTDAAATEELGTLLRTLARGELRPADGSEAPWAVSDESGGAPWQAATVLRDVQYVVVTGADGRVRASSAPEGASLSVPERAEWEAPLQRALSGERDTRQLVHVRASIAARERGVASVASSGPAALGAYPILNRSGRPVGAILVATGSLPELSAQSVGTTLVGVVAAATALVLLSAPFGLPAAAAIGYLLSRKLVRRLEHLGGAAEALAAGNLTRRVAEGSPDEVGQLARRFNRMADRLATTVSELERARANAEAALTAKRDLVANVSHELRTPLALIRSHVESLLMYRPTGVSDGAETESYLAVIQRETDQLSHLIDDLFALSTAETGALPLKIERVPLAEVAQEVVDSVAPVAKRERRITVVAEHANEPEQAPHALADRQRLVQIIGNLIRNALRHTPAGGLIAVRSQEHGSRATLVIEDTGEGIPPEQLPHVFQRFYRGGEGRERASGGAGLGLAIVKELVEAMQGTVSVESEVGRGTRFTISLPLAAVSSQTGHTAAAVR